jgi:hypothetical protein
MYYNMAYLSKAMREGTTMNAKPKKPVSLRLSETTANELEALAKRYKVSQADVVSVLVHCIYTNGEIEEEKLKEWFGVLALG